jgi:hypothetical protein
MLARRQRGCCHQRQPQHVTRLPESNAMLCSSMAAAAFLLGSLKSL